MEHNSTTAGPKGQQEKGRRREKKKFFEDVNSPFSFLLFFLARNAA
jgi:hypothetical protein